jgi:hypothetical protein
MHEPDIQKKIATPRFLSFSPMEWVIILMGGCGYWTLWLSFPTAAWKMFLTLYGLGFLFEASMEPLFTYHLQLRERHCIGKTDVNFLFPAAWMNVVGCSVLLSEKVLLPHLPIPPLAGYVIGAFIAGNVHEFFFYRLTFWTYNYHAAMIGTFKPFTPVITVAGIPVQVIVGYCNVGLMVFFLIKNLF